MYVIIIFSEFYEFKLKITNFQEFLNSFLRVEPKSLFYIDKEPKPIPTKDSKHTDNNRLSRVCYNSLQSNKIN